MLHMLFFSFAKRTRFSIALDLTLMVQGKVKCIEIKKDYGRIKCVGCFYCRIIDLNQHSSI